MASKQVVRVVKKATLGMALCVALAGTVQAQSTTANIYGSAPAETGLTVEVKNDSGLVRNIPVGANGRFTIGSLPIGNYTVTLRRGDQVIETRENVLLKVGTGTDVSFAGAGGPAGDAKNLETVTVTAAVPKVDVSATDSRSVFTAQDLQRLPIQHSAEAIALLAPGTVSGSGFFSQGQNAGATSGAISFGGAGANENAYYVNGFNTTNPYSGIGGIGLPYGSIAQQEAYLGGYSARYGRSAGGVISQVGMSGTNEWKFGGSVIWAPKKLNASRKSTNYADFDLPTQEGTGNAYEWETNSFGEPGSILRDRSDDRQTVSTYSLYAGGPLVQDRLFFFIAGEQERTEGLTTSNIEGQPEAFQNNFYRRNPKLYGKINWNITDDHLLEYTYIQNHFQSGGFNKAYDYETRQAGDRNGTFPDQVKDHYKFDILKYTGYLSDDVTLSATWGRSTHTFYQDNQGNLPTLPRITGAGQQDPALNGGTPINRANATDAVFDSKDETRALRVDLEWRLGDHTLSGGVDNMRFAATNGGQGMGGIGYRWSYGHAASGAANVNAGLGVGPAGGDGYYVWKTTFVTATNMQVDQDAYFLEDRWQISDNFLLTLGVRNDQFTNKNYLGESYVDSGDQWAPRLGASWDVFGDSSLKLYANLGRYYLALPNSVNVRGASASTFTREYYTYTGIDEFGQPTGTALIPLNNNDHLCPGLGDGNAVSSNLECNQLVDAKAFAATDLKNMFQDELILGFDKTLGDKWVTGAKVTYRKLGTTIDDICDTGRIAEKMTAEGLDPNSVVIPGCVMFNPGSTNTFSLANADGNGRTSVRMTKQDWGLSNEAKRDYLGVNMYIEHPFDGKWQGRLDYTWSRNFGNTEGQLKSDIGQTDVSKTQDWDAAAIMAYSGGYLANDRRHQLKAYGAYQFAPEWTASATMRIQSGTPKSCLGLFSVNGIEEGTDASDPIGYLASYHTCAGKAMPPGEAGRTPWTYQLDLGLQYRPNFADGKLGFGMQVYNALNQQRPVQTDAGFGTGDAYIVSGTYGTPLFYQTPRYVQFSASYDF